jgi:hypothetical protein
MGMAPAVSSTSPPKITTLVSPRAESAAVSANGTVRPYERPMIASDMKRASNVVCFFLLNSPSGLPRVLLLVDNISKDLWRTMESFFRPNELNSSSAATGLQGNVCEISATDMVRQLCVLRLLGSFVLEALDCFANFKFEAKNSGKSRQSNSDIERVEKDERGYPRKAMMLWRREAREYEMVTLRNQL